MAGLYIHIPYCHAKCAYCDFYSIPKIDNLNQYIDALITEMKLRKDEISPNLISTVYIGGGTPSILPFNQLSKLIKNIYNLYGKIFIEFTIEANPEDITPQWCKNIYNIGINRVSMGIQSFSDIELKAINRRHNSQQALNTIDIMRENGIVNISGDIIYGLPHQDIDSWNMSLDKLLSLYLPHFSAYLLSYEPGTKLYAQLITGKLSEASDSLVTSMYNTLIDKAAKCGYNHYEISNFSLEGKQAIHNTNYWKNEPYIGLGVSAHSFDGINRRYNPSNIKSYISSLLENKLCYIIENESETERYNDMIITRLRTSDGINVNELKNNWSKFYNQFIITAQTLINEGKIISDNSKIYIPEKYMLLSDSIMREFIQI